MKLTDIYKDDQHIPTRASRTQIFDKEDKLLQIRNLKQLCMI